MQLISTLEGPYIASYRAPVWTASHSWRHLARLLVAPGRCFRMIYSSQLRSTHWYEPPVWRGYFHVARCAAIVATPLVLVGTGATSALAAGTTSGTVSVWSVQKIDGASAPILFTGAIGDYGTATSQGQERQGRSGTGAVTLYGGAGAHAGITGTIQASVTFAFVDPKKASGKCNASETCNRSPPTRRSRVLGRSATESSARRRGTHWRPGREQRLPLTPT